MEISFKYSYIAKTFMLTIFYLPLFPLGAVISVAGIVLAYFVEKRNLLYYYKRPEMLNTSICTFYINYFKLFLFVYAVGNWIFIRIDDDDNVFGFIFLIGSAVLIFLPFHRLFRIDCIGIKEKDINRKEYNEVYFDFNIDYERSNPITKREGNLNYIKRLQKAGIISKSEYDQIQKLDANTINPLDLYYGTNHDMNSRVINQMANVFKPKYKEKQTGTNFGEGLVKNVLGIQMDERQDNSKNKNIRNKLFNNLIQNNDTDFLEQMGFNHNILQSNLGQRAVFKTIYKKEPNVDNSKNENPKPQSQKKSLFKNLYKNKDKDKEVEMEKKPSESGEDLGIEQKYVENLPEQHEIVQECKKPINNTQNPTIYNHIHQDVPHYNQNYPNIYNSPNFESPNISHSPQPFNSNTKGNYDYNQNSGPYNQHNDFNQDDNEREDENEINVNNEDQPQNFQDPVNNPDSQNPDSINRYFYD